MPYISRWKRNWFTATVQSVYLTRFWPELMLTHDINTGTCIDVTGGARKTVLTLCNKLKKIMCWWIVLEACHDVYLYWYWVTCPSYKCTWLSNKCAFNTYFLEIKKINNRLPINCRARLLDRWELCIKRHQFSGIKSCQKTFFWELYRHRYKLIITYTCDQEVKTRKIDAVF